MKQLFTHANVILEHGIQPDSFVEVDTDSGIITGLGHMQELSCLPEHTFDCQGRYLSPGFIDIHTHGGGGCDFMDGDVDSILAASRLHLHHGTTSIYPTTLTSSDSDQMCIRDSL